MIAKWQDATVAIYNDLYNGKLRFPVAVLMYHVPPPNTLHIAAKWQRQYGNGPFVTVVTGMFRKAI